MRNRTTWRSAATFAIMIIAALTARAEDKKPASAEETVKDYVKMVKDKQASKAVETFWDFDTMLAGVFGEAMKKHTKEETTEMHDRLLKFLRTIFASEQVAAAMADATYSDYVSKEIDANQAGVDFNVTLNGQKIANKMVLAKKADGWLIVDAGNSGNMLVSSLKKAFEQAGAADKALTPLAFIRMMTKTANE